MTTSAAARELVAALPGLKTPRSRTLFDALFAVRPPAQTDVRFRWPGHVQRLIAACRRRRGRHVTERTADRARRESS